MRFDYAFQFTASAMVLTTACSTIDPNSHVDGWPELMPVEHRVSFNEVQDRCRTFVGWGQLPMACAAFHFRDLECHIYYAFDWALEHERQHCLGYDHPGSEEMRLMLRAWKASNGK